MRNGLILYVLSFFLFFIGRYAFTDSFLKYSGFINSFVFPVLYALVGVISAYQYVKAGGEQSFRAVFKATFFPMFIGGGLLMISIYLYMNFIDKESIELLRRGLITNLEQNIAMVKNTDVDKRQQFDFVLFGVKDSSFLNLKQFILLFIFPIILPFYCIISLICALFYRKA